MTDKSTELVLTAPRPEALSVFGSVAGFETAQRMAQALASSDLVPEMYRGPKGIGNCLIAMEVAARTGASILSVTQNLYVIGGRPSWSSSYIIAAINTCGRFAPLRFEMTGAGDTRACYAWTVDSSGQRLDGPEVSIAMAKKEGWYGKNGSKWQTMPELMIRYRAAAFFGRLYAPDVLMGMQTAEESEDIGPQEPRNVTPSPAPPVIPPGPIVAEADAPKKRGRPPKANGPAQDAPEVPPPAVAGPVITPPGSVTKTQQHPETSDVDFFL